MFEGKEPPKQAGVLSVGFLGSASAQEPVGNECCTVVGASGASKAGLSKQVWCLGWVLFWEV